MFPFNEESRKCSVPIVQNYNKNQFCAHKQNRNKPFVNYELAAASSKGEKSLFISFEKLSNGNGLKYLKKNYIFVFSLSLLLSFAKSN